MLVFGHAGITLGAALIIQSAIREKPGTAVKEEAGQRVCSAISFINGLDLRLLLVGSLLPDIIDKPIGLVILRESMSYGRIYAHTLLFLLLIALGGFWLYRLKHKQWLLTLAIGTASHLILDGMWATPIVLLWPLLGTAFPRQDVSNYFLQLLQDLMTQPDVLIGEIVGVIVALVIGIMMRKKTKGLCNFLHKGQLL